MLLDFVPPGETLEQAELRKRQRRHFKGIYIRAMSPSLRQDSIKELDLARDTLLKTTDAERQKSSLVRNRKAYIKDLERRPDKIQNTSLFRTNHRSIDDVPPFELY